MSQFFEKLEAESKGQNPPQFLSDHPSPEHRVERVNEEIDKLGGAPPNARRDSADFEATKREVLALPVAKKPTQTPTSGGPPRPSGNFAEYQGRTFSLKYPDNWGTSESGGGASFIPPGGVVQGGDGQGALACGVIVNVAQVQVNPNDANALQSATQQLIEELQKSNPNMRVARQPGPVKLNGQPGLSTYLSNASPTGGQETDWLITVPQPQGLLYFLCVAPQAAYADYEKTFATILDSARLAH